MKKPQNVYYLMIDCPKSRYVIDALGSSEKEASVNAKNEISSKYNIRVKDLIVRQVTQRWTDVPQTKDELQRIYNEAKILGKGKMNMDYVYDYQVIGIAKLLNIKINRK